MPLSPAAPRQHLHTRKIEVNGYLREDGMWDIEAHLTDVKAYAFDNTFRGRVEPGDPLHEMWMRLTVDDDMTIRAAETTIEKHPYPPCPGIASNVATKLVGLSIRAGFHARARERLGGTEGCTHLVELLGPVATTAFQTIHPYRSHLRRLAGKSHHTSTDKPKFIDTCHGYRSDGLTVKTLWPEFYTGPKE